METDLFLLLKQKVLFFFNFSFVFNSIYFTNQFSSIFASLFEIKPVVYETKGKTTTWYALRFNYDNKRYDKIKEIYKYLYEDSTVFLKRKKEKFDNYLEYRAKRINKTNTSV